MKQSAVNTAADKQVALMIATGRSRRKVNVRTTPNTNNNKLPGSEIIYDKMSSAPLK
jgi:hypothetical protein